MQRNRRPERSDLPSWIKSQLSLLVKTPPTGDDWLHEIKLDGYRMHARIDHGCAQLLTRNGLDWTRRYPTTANALAKLRVKQAYIDGELCGLRPDGIPSFALIQAATDAGTTTELVYYAFDLLPLDGENLMPRPLLQRKERLEACITNNYHVRFNEHHLGGGAAFHREACRLGLEGTVSKRTDAPYRPGNRGIWQKTKCLNRQEFIIVGWSDPEGSRPYIGSLLLGYYDGKGRLIYAGRVGTGMSQDELERLHRKLKPLAIKKMPLAEPPPRETRFGSPLELSRVHWLRPELVVEVSYLTWTADGLLRQVVYQGLREDKSARHVRREA